MDTDKTNFIKQIIDTDIKNGKNDGKVITRFPPEPNGYLHIGHAKSICLNFGIGETYNGPCHLRFDDTNPEKEDQEYVDSIIEDIKWLGYDWKNNLFHASDYFEKLYNYAVELIKMGKAFVCDLTPDQIRDHRGNLKTPGKDSPYRNRSMEENLELFQSMKAGKFDEGSHCLRAKIDMAHPNINMRDPVIYRIKKVTHQRTGDQWVIYPMYDFTHPLSDMIEGITHSLCTLEFEDHRPFYDWLLETLKTPCHPQQIEFARLNLEYTVMSKRKLLQLVTEKHVKGWDDPRMPTISGMRRRGYPPKSIKNFCDVIGVTKKDSSISMSTLESAVRTELESFCPRYLGVLDPIKVTITNWEDEKVQEIEAPLHPKDESFGTRKLFFTKEIFIDRNDFLEDPPKKFFRLRPGGNVRLRYGYVITCDEVIKNENGEVSELRCTYHQESFAGKTPEGMKKVKGIIHWVSATHSQKVKFNIYDRLFVSPTPGKDHDGDFHKDINPDSLIEKTGYLEPDVINLGKDKCFQLERTGYFIQDKDSDENNLQFNRIITLKDTWAKLEKGN